MSASVLVVEDDAGLRATLRRVLASAGFVVSECADGAEADARLARDEHDVVLLDLGLPGKSGLELLIDHAARRPSPAFVVLSGHDDGDVTIAAMKHGAYDFLLKPPDLDHLIGVLEGAVRIVREPGGAPAREHPPTEALLGRSEAMRAVFKAVGRVARSRATVLVTGESGTGKELVARAIHAAGAPEGAPFVAVNCAAITGSLLHSELFGHARGAFTGATADHAGRFEDAADGTLLLDEIGELEVDLQAKLLRVLEQRTFERVGEGTPRPLQARIVAATNRDLRAAVAAGRFRADLLHRLDVVSIHLPPLRDRPEDIPVLVEHLLDRVAADVGVASRIDPDTVPWLQSRPWPGNVRQLYNALRRAAVLVQGPITVEALRETEGGSELEDDAAEPRSLDDVERAHIEATLERLGWHKRRTAEALGISRVTLDRKIRRYGLSREGDAGVDDDDA